MCKDCVRAVGKLVISCGQKPAFIHRALCQLARLWLNRGFYTPFFQPFSTLQSTVFNEVLRMKWRGFPRYTQNLSLLTTN